MNRILTTWRVLLGCTAAILLSTSVWAAPGGGMGGGMMGGDPGRGLERMTNRLDLSAEQQQQVQSIVDASRKQSVADLEQMRNLRQQLAPMVQNFDADKARGIADKIGKLTGTMVYRASETHAEIYKLLDDEQKAKMDSMMQERESRRDSMKGGRLGGVRPDS